MPQWMRVARGMIGTGIVFSAGIGTAAAVVGAVLSVFTDLSLVNVIVPAARFAVLGFPIGIAFSGMLAMVARGRSIDTLSIPRFAAMGATVGLLAFLLLGISGFGTWSEGDYVLTFLLLPGVGAAVAALSLLVARGASEGNALAAGPGAAYAGRLDAPMPSLRAGDDARNSDVTMARGRERERERLG